jgi:serine/threonine protein kinase
VPTLDVVALDGELFLVMEFVQGESLAHLARAVLKKRDRIPLPIAVAIMSGVLQGLHAAHDARSERGDALGIVHRDVSPQNILVGADGVARVLDFGVAKAVGRVQSSREGQIKGKLAYMAPEQVTAGPVNRQTDIFSASIVLWELLASRRLFRGQNEADTLYNVLQAPIEPPSKYTRGISGTIDDVVMRGLQRDRSKRYGSAREMAIQLEKAAPIVSAREVGEWVERVARDTLLRRAKQLAEVEMVPTVGLRPSSRPPPSMADDSISVLSHPHLDDSSLGALSGTDGGSTRTVERAGLVKRHPLLAVAGALATLSVFLGVWLLLSRSDPVPVSAAGTKSHIASEPTAQQPTAAPEPPVAPMLPSDEGTAAHEDATPSVAASAIRETTPPVAERRRTPTRVTRPAEKKPARSIYSRE